MKRRRGGVMIHVFLISIHPIMLKNFAIHGHHFNVLHNQKELFLVDWDGLKLAPCERDLWHYEKAPLIANYNAMNRDFVLNQELCRFYLWQRFLEDTRYYLEQDYSSLEQAHKDRQSFMKHWGWAVCINDTMVSFEENASEDRDNGFSNF